MKSEFPFINIAVDKNIPADTIIAISARKRIGDQLEPVEDWAKRCCIITNIGVSDE